MNDLASRWADLRLTDEESHPMAIGASSSFLPTASIQMCVMEKLMSSHMINLEAFRSVMKSIWRVHHGTRFELVRENVFDIQFRSLLENNKVLLLGHWTFEKGLLVLVPLTETDRPDLVEFTYCSFRIQVHNVPFQLQTREMGVRFGEVVGRVEVVSGEDTLSLIGPFLCIRVCIDVRQPLRRSITIQVFAASTIWGPIRYERLSDFCYYSSGTLESRMWGSPVSCLIVFTGSYGGWLGRLFHGIVRHPTGAVRRPDWWPLQVQRRFQGTLRPDMHQI